MSPLRIEVDMVLFFRVMGLTIRTGRIDWIDWIDGNLLFIPEGLSICRKAAEKGGWHPVGMRLFHPKPWLGTGTFLRNEVHHPLDLLQTENAYGIANQTGWTGWMDGLMRLIGLIRLINRTGYTGWIGLMDIEDPTDENRQESDSILQRKKRHENPCLV